jgi:hypothetical protein
VVVAVDWARRDAPEAAAPGLDLCLDRGHAHVQDSSHAEARQHQAGTGAVTAAAQATISVGCREGSDGPAIGAAAIGAASVTAGAVASAAWATAVG